MPEASEPQGGREQDGAWRALALSQGGHPVGLVGEVLDGGTQGERSAGSSELIAYAQVMDCVSWCPACAGTAASRTGTAGIE